MYFLFVYFCPCSKERIKESRAVRVAAKYPIAEITFCFSLDLFCLFKYSLKSFAKSLKGFLIEMPPNVISAPFVFSRNFIRKIRS